MCPSQPLPGFRVAQVIITLTFCFCRKQYRKRHIRTDDDDPNYEYQSEYTVRLFRQIGCNAARHITPTSPPKRRIMNHGPGQPTQVHGVPIEERAIDSKGNLLPWAIVFGESVLLDLCVQKCHTDQYIAVIQMHVHKSDILKRKGHSANLRDVKVLQEHGR